MSKKAVDKIERALPSPRKYRALPTDFAAKDSAALSYAVADAHCASMCQTAHCVSMRQTAHCVSMRQMHALLRNYYNGISDSGRL